MQASLRCAVPLLAAAILTAACGQPPQSPTSPFIPPASGTTSTGSAAVLADPEAEMFSMEQAGMPAAGRGPCVFDHPSAQFTCTSDRNGLTFTRTVTFYDASGAVQPRYDAITTASIKTETSVSGTMTTPVATVTINRAGVMVASGLAGNETTRTMNGTETGTVVTTGGTGDQAFTSTSSITGATNNLVVPVPAGTARDTAAGYPLSGTRSHAAVTTTTRGSDTRTHSVMRTETFNGTPIVQVVLTINGVTQHCTINLATRQTTCTR